MGRSSARCEEPPKSPVKLLRVDPTHNKKVHFIVFTFSIHYRTSKIQICFMLRTMLTFQTHSHTSTCTNFYINIHFEKVRLLIRTFLDVPLLLLYYCNGELNEPQLLVLIVLYIWSKIGVGSTPNCVESYNQRSRAKKTISFPIHLNDIVFLIISIITWIFYVYFETFHCG